MKLSDLLTLLCCFWEGRPFGAKVINASSSIAKWYSLLANHNKNVIATSPMELLESGVVIDRFNSGWLIIDRVVPSQPPTSTTTTTCQSPSSILGQEFLL